LLAKKCSRCKQKEKRPKHAWCRDCCTEYMRAWRDKPGNRKRLSERQRKYVQSPDRKLQERARGLWRKYKLTLEEYEKMLDDQEGCCAICGTDKNERGGRDRPLAVDHCHVSGRVRSLLCDRCNSILGYADDSADRLLRAALYLIEFQGGGDAI